MGNMNPLAEGHSVPFAEPPQKIRETETQSPGDHGMWPLHKQDQGNSLNK